MVRHLGIWYDWRTDKNDEPYVVATMNSLVEEIIKVTEQHLGRTLCEKDTPGKAGDVLEGTEDPVVEERCTEQLWERLCT